MSTATTQPPATPANAPETQTKEYRPTLLGMPIINRCPCGVNVAIYERQELAFDPKYNFWVRVCEKCIQDGRHVE